MHVIDRYHSFKSGNIPKTEGCQNHLNFMTVLLSSWNSPDVNRFSWNKGTLKGECPCLPPTTILRHVVVLRPSPLPQFCRTCGEKTSSGEQEHYILKIF